jgi:hypothetical protein
MHHPRSLAAVIRLRLAAILLLANCLLAVATVGLLIHSLVANNRPWTMVGAALAVLFPMLVVVQWIAAARAGCPLCRTPVLAPKWCMKHRQARTLLGSHRLRVATAILCSNQFRCPYCNESTRLKIREAIHRPRSRSPQFDELR